MMIPTNVAITAIMAIFSTLSLGPFGERPSLSGCSVTKPPSPLELDSVPNASVVLGALLPPLSIGSVTVGSMPLIPVL